MCYSSGCGVGLLRADSAVFDRQIGCIAGCEDARRDGWPTWRRAVRPIALAIFWIGVVWFSFFARQGNLLQVVTRVIWVACLSPFILIGIREWIRDGEAAQTRDRMRGPSAPG